MRVKGALVQSSHLTETVRNLVHLLSHPMLALSFSPLTHVAAACASTSVSWHWSLLVLLFVLVSFSGTAPASLISLLHPWFCALCPCPTLYLLRHMKVYTYIFIHLHRALLYEGNCPSLWLSGLSLPNVSPWLSVSLLQWCAVSTSHILSLFTFSGSIFLGISYLVS